MDEQPIPAEQPKPSAQQAFADAMQRLRNARQQRIIAERIVDLGGIALQATQQSVELEAIVRMLEELVPGTGEKFWQVATLVAIEHAAILERPPIVIAAHGHNGKRQ
jgi:molybdopterin biosynthesis enzyme MoaB